MLKMVENLKKNRMAFNNTRGIVKDAAKNYSYDYIIWNRHDKKVLMDNADRFIRHECFNDGVYEHPVEIDNGVVIKRGE